MSISTEGLEEIRAINNALPFADPIADTEAHEKEELIRAFLADYSHAVSIFDLLMIREASASVELDRDSGVQTLHA